MFPAAVYFGVASFAGPRPDYPSYAGVSETATQEERQQAHDAYEAALELYEEKQEAFSQTLFWIAIPLGLVAIAAGAIRRLGDVGTGLIVAGISTIAEGHYGAWDYVSDELRFVSFLAGLGLLLVVAYRRLA